MPVTARTQSTHQTPEGGTPGWVSHYEDVNRGVSNFLVMTPNTRRCPQTPLSPDPITGQEAIDLFMPQKSVYQDAMRPSWQINRNPLDGEYYQSALRGFLRDAMTLPAGGRGELDGLAPDSTHANPNGQIVVPRSGTFHTGNKRAFYRIRNNRRTTLFRMGNAEVRNTTYTELGHVKPARNADVREAILRDPLPESAPAPNNGLYVPQKEIRSDRPTTKEAAINRVGTANAWRGNGVESIRPEADNVESSIRRRKLLAGVLIGPQHPQGQGAGILTVLDKRLHPRLCTKSNKKKEKNNNVDQKTMPTAEDKKNVRFMSSREEFASQPTESNPTLLSYTLSDGEQVDVANCNYDNDDDDDSDNEVIQIRHPEERPSLAMATIIGKNKFSDPAPEAGARHVRDNGPRNSTNTLRFPKRLAYQTSKNRSNENDVRNRQSIGQASQRNSGNVVTLNVPKRLAQQTTKNRSNENDVRNRQSLGQASQRNSGNVITLTVPKRLAQQTTKNRSNENDVRNRQSMGQASQRNSGNVITLTIPKRLAQQTTKNRSNENDVAHRQSLGYSSNYLSGHDLPDTNRQMTEVNKNHGYYNVPQRPGLRTQAASTFTDHTPVLTNRAEQTDAPGHANIPAPARPVGANGGIYTQASSQRTHAVDFLDEESRQNQPERQRGSLGATTAHSSCADFRPNIKGYMMWLRTRVPNGVNPLGTTADMFAKRRVHFNADGTRVISHDGEEQLAGRPMHYGQVGIGRRTNGFLEGNAHIASPVYNNRMDPGTDILTPLYNNPYKVWAS